jgi:4-diphosphocytidyl-2-C-methyl-D-erythritol kinase
MQRLYNGLSGGLLRDVALSVGADVPFCLNGGTARAEGVGEILSPIQSPTLYYVIAKPQAGVSTKKLFSSLPLPRKKPDTAAAICALGEGDIQKLGRLLYNALEETAAAMVPEIGQLKGKLLNAGALGACMSGSGSAVFGLFESEEAAQAAEEAVSDAAFCCTCHTV